MGEHQTLPDTAEGFARFYQLIFERPLPRHALEWVQALYAAQAAGKGAVIEAFRGSSKTTSLTIAFAAFRLGLAPHKSVLLIQSSNDVAIRTCQEIANLIECNPGWKQTFPNIVPDHKIGWSVRRGWELKDANKNYDEWRALCIRTKGKDPSLVGYGYQSRAIIGKHPTAMLIVDDIHDETNTRSTRRLQTVTDILKGTILPTLTPGAWQLFVGTPWTENDALAYLKSTGEYVCVSTPVYTECSSPIANMDMNGSDSIVEHIANVKTDTSPLGAVCISAGGGLEGQCNRPSSGGRGSAPEKEKPIRSGPELPMLPVASRSAILNIVPTWPERFPPEEIDRRRRLVGASEFARMYLLDLKAAQGIYLRKEWLQGFPLERITPDWPTIMGVDYASSVDGTKDGRRDYFAVAIGRAMPNGGTVVLTGGYRGLLSQGEAELKVKDLVALHPNTHVVAVESIGKGEEFFNLLFRKWGLPVKPMGTGGRKKGERFQKGMAPLFENGHARIADLESPFLTAFREEWLRWPRSDHDDTLDAVYYMLRGAEQHLFTAGQRSKADNPFASWGEAA